jgi:hypothetical protein
MRHLQSGQAHFNQQLIGQDANSIKALGGALLSGFANA